uniref:F-box domain-containing protein n=1 Tax=Caenorhabditis tropicalis TaxID=1561998 RepID=A0A1I7TD16_9PELO
MDKTPIDWVDLPMEMQQMLVGKCDLHTRWNLRAVSSSVNELVDATKLFYSAVRVQENYIHGITIKLIHKLFKDEYTFRFKKNESGGTRIWRSFSPNDLIMENSEPETEAFEFLKTMCFRKNVTIGRFDFETISFTNKLEDKLEEVINGTPFPMKIRAIHWKDSKYSQSIWKLIDKCDGRHLKELKVSGRLPHIPLVLFGKNDEKLRNLERIEVECDCNATDEDVMSLNASIISIKSKLLTHGMVTRLIEKFTEKRSNGSFFIIDNPSEEDLSSLTIPAGFQVITNDPERMDYFNELVEGKKASVVLRVNENYVRLQVNPAGLHFFEEKFFIAPPEDSDFDDYYNVEDNEDNDFYGNGFDMDPNYDFDFEGDLYESDLYESDLDDFEFKYDY